MINAAQEQRTALDVVEAFLQYKPAPTGPWSVQARAGIFYPQISLENTGLGRLDPDDDDHAWVSVGKVRALAAGRVTPKWAENFDVMLEKSVKHGFYDAATEELKGHVEWIGREQEITEFEAPADEVDYLASMLREEMSGVHSLRVPLKVDVKAGPNWADARGIG